MWYLLILALVLPDSAAFKPLAKSSEIEVSIARLGDQAPWVSASHKIPAPAEKIFDHLAAFDKYETLFTGVVKKAVVLSRSENSARLHVVWPLPFPMSNRDAVIKYEATRADGKFQIDWIQAPQKGDPEEGLRIDLVQGRTIIESLGEAGAMVHYLYYGDLGGNLPDFIKEGSYKEEPVIYFNSIRKALGLTPIASVD